MKFTLATIAANAVSLACVVIAGYLALNGKTGWGWFLIVGLLCTGSVKMSDGKSS